MDSIPILRFGDVLLVSVQVDLHDRLAMTLQDDLTNALAKAGARGVVLDISGLDLVDSFIGRVISNIASATRLMGAQTVLVGMRPAVAITLVELGLSLGGVQTALDAERAIGLLREGRGMGDRQRSDRQHAQDALLDQVLAAFTEGREASVGDQ
jgi:rsbT antagonist protein RsbS